MSVHKLVRKKKIKVHGKPGCAGKKRFRSLEQAKEALTSIRFRSELLLNNGAGEGRFPIRAYPCSNCMGYHLTSLALSERLSLSEIAS